MEGLGNIASYGWAGAAALLVALLLYVFLRHAKKEDAAAAERARQRQELEEAETDWATALTKGDVARAHALKLRIDELRRGLGLGAALLCLALCGCLSAPAPAPEVRTVALSEHCRVVHPGDTVPELPAGEPLYLLCTPTGLAMLLPADSTLPFRPREGAE